jgi:hypothetical protein
MMAIAGPTYLQDGSLLLYYLDIRPNGVTDGPPAKPTEPEWIEILRQAGENGVTPLLYHRLKAIAPSPKVPPLVLDCLRDAAVQSAAQNLQIGRELAHVLEAFHHHGIAAIVLKGAYLGQVVYESFALRPMCDLDVMVRRDKLAQAESVLAELGYVPQYSGVEQVDYAHHHHLRPMAKPGGIPVEIHWSLARPNAHFEVDIEGLWERARRTTIGGVDALVLSPEDLILHLCLHASFGHRFRVGVRACWDIREVVRHHGDAIVWDQVAQRARQWGIGKYVYLTLRLARELLAADVPVAVIAALEPPDFSPEVVAWARTCIFTPERDETVSVRMATLWTSRRLMAKFGAALGALYPSPATIARMYRAQPGSRRILLYYPIRWVDLFLRYGRQGWQLWRGDPRRQGELRVVSERAALNDWLRPR